MNRLPTFALLIVLCGSVACRQARRDVEIHLHNANLNNALSLYAAITRRTMLQGMLPPVSVDLEKSAMTREEAAAFIAAALVARGIAIIPDGEKFAVVVSSAQAPKEKERLAKTGPARKSSDAKSKDEKADIEINFPAMGLDQVADFYAKLAGASGVEKGGIPGTSITLCTQANLTRTEAIYALDTIFHLNGIKIVPGKDGKIKVVPESAK